ncbi:hypothetical protein GLYMA_19G117900v4 [Glycine max]|uniref:Uncharacterized protein n=2 Tax=Glycine subgen. Soja TaxID=1462606 RepID=A0A0R0EVM4_SOYBN|nr:uncharacterized protein LOC100527025 isoform X1 [Glycine max]XP_028217764.1 uncharacterized protein LOC114399749 isoform X1 [Glycine soja]KAG4915719.1 hypothetical protein JHK87_053276 [Glycine soja]KAH1077423.1 hypothetical protein GYH30_052785 [Glycine max]KAH1194428.1 hypothetical protein GmHk_19G055225 [Glycine max]KRG94919.1 hypothetical protein GLYMA_19G117900v4 [Glycine max]RZB47510.1 hypothetical protein D0Y65_051217 [Glycine soja]|eukprot:XP_006603673.1 uncharacterized protein LOC100527025 isoform X1 [Glycine max]
MDKNALFRFLLVLLTLSCVVFVAAVPAIRSSMIGKIDPLVQDLLAKVLSLSLSLQEDPVMRLRNSEEEMKEGIVESRMLMDIVDYPGTRPNPAHDPKSPGKP